MKFKILIFLLLIVLAFSCKKHTKTMSSVECKVCSQEVFINGVYDHDVTAEQEYCGTDLTTIEEIPEVTVGNTTTKWVCN